MKRCKGSRGECWCEGYARNQVEPRDAQLQELSAGFSSRAPKEVASSIPSEWQQAALTAQLRDSDHSLKEDSFSGAEA